MKRSYMLALFCALFISIAAQDVIDLMQNKSPLRKTGKVEVLDNCIQVTAPKAGSHGFRFVDGYDFTGYGKMKLTVQNMHASRPLYLYVYMMNDDLTFREPVKGIQARKYTLLPGETRNIDYGFLPPLPHPEVSDQFRLMRNTPYSRLTKSFCYDIDLSKIKYIVVGAAKMEANQKFRVLNAKVYRTATERLPKELAYDSAHFFPFIDQYGQFKYADWKNKIRTNSDLQKQRKKEQKDLKAHPGATCWSKFGGYKAGPKLEATGHFRVQKIDGKWWMIDPEGYLFWSNGMVRVTTSTAITPLEGKNLQNRCFYFENLPEEGTEFAQFYRTHDALLKPYYTARDIDSTYDFSSANCYRKYGKNYKEVFAELAHQRLRSWGFNTIANSSDKDICMMGKTAYTDRFEVVSKPLEGTTGWWPFMDPFDESFNESLRQQFINRKAETEDPWCLGMFVDNEIKWKDVTYLAEMTLKAPAQQEAKKAMLQWLQQKYPSINDLNKTWQTKYASWQELLENRADVTANKYNKDDLRAFNQQIIRKYFSNIKNAFQQYAPGLLYMGCRFAGDANEDVTRIGAEYCDVMSYNSYQYDLNNFKVLDIDIPVMIGEYHFGAMDRGMFHPSLIDVENQQQRGEAVERYVKSALLNPYIIGVHWHQFSDQATTGRFDGEDFQVGFTDCCDTPYEETINGMRKVGYNMYQIRREEALK